MLKSLANYSGLRLWCYNTECEVLRYGRLRLKLKHNSSENRIVYVAQFCHKEKAL